MFLSLPFAAFCCLAVYFFAIRRDSSVDVEFVFFGEDRGGLSLPPPRHPQTPPDFFLLSLVSSLLPDDVAIASGRNPPPSGALLASPALPPQTIRSALSRLCFSSSRLNLLQAGLE